MVLIRQHGIQTGALECPFRRWLLAVLPPRAIPSSHRFSPPALYQRLSAAVGEQEALCRGLEESFLEGQDATGTDAVASEREVAEFVRRLREGRKIAYLRTERKERWDEGRVGGWR